MMAIASDNHDSLMQENESHLKSSEEALLHLEEVISHVISEAVEYADKPPEERTLPVLVRKSVAQARKPITNSNYGQFAVSNNGTNLLGFGQMGAYGFSQVPDQMLSNQRFQMQNAALMQQNPQRIMAQYNSIQPSQYHTQNAQLHQQYTQACQQFQIQQQAQYQMQLHHQQAAAVQQQAAAVAAAQQQQMMYAGSPPFSRTPTATPTTATSCNPQVASPSTAVSSMEGQPQQSLTPQQLHQLSAAYVAAHHQPGVISTFNSAQQVQSQEQASQITATTPQHQQWTGGSQASAYQQQAANPPETHQQQQFLHAHQVQAHAQAAQHQYVQAQQQLQSQHSPQLHQRNQNVSPTTALSADLSKYSAYQHHTLLQQATQQYMIGRKPD